MLLGGYSLPLTDLTLLRLCNDDLSRLDGGRRTGGLLALLLSKAFSDMMDYTQELSARIHCFLLKLAFVTVFYHNDRKKLEQTPNATVPDKLSTHLLRLAVKEKHILKTRSEPTGPAVCCPNTHTLT